MNNKFQIFGSVSSEDYDVMVFVDEIPNSAEIAIIFGINVCAVQA